MGGKMKNLFLYLYMSTSGEHLVYCQKIGHGYYLQVPGFKDDRFVTLNCGPGLRNANISKSKLDPDVIITLESRILEITSQYDKTIAISLYPNVSK
jgi:hypothetical protein